MAKLYNAERIEINGSDLSDHTVSADVIMTKAALDTKNMTSTGEERIPGLSDDQFVFNFQQNFAASELHSVLSALYASGATFTVKVRATTAAISATNPSFEGTCVLLEYPPLSGAVGELAMVSVTIPVNGAISIVTA